MADSNASDLSAPLLSRRARAAKRRADHASHRRSRPNLPVARLAIAGIGVLVAAMGLWILIVG